MAHHLLVFVKKRPEKSSSRTWGFIPKESTEWCAREPGALIVCLKSAELLVQMDVYGVFTKHVLHGKFRTFNVQYGLIRVKFGILVGGPQQLDNEMVTTKQDALNLWSPVGL